MSADLLFGRAHGRGNPVAEVSIKRRIWEALRPTERQWADWKWHFRNRLTTVEQLSRIIPLTEAEKSQIELVSRTYPFAVTPYYLSLAREDDLQDPILRQVIPSIEECDRGSAGDDDPLAERRYSPVPGVVHRYPDRALLVLSNLCPLLCRHCTRKREWAAGGWVRPRSELRRAIDYIRGNSSLRDVVISGGDPLSLSNTRLAQILADLRSIPHLEIIRLGTRFPVALPQRIDEGFCRMCDTYGPIWLNTHFNHPNEVTPEAAAAVRKLLRAGVPVNNQTVLLRGVNDTLETQLRLAHELLKIRVRPYYLYQADEVRGAEHFRTPVETGIGILEGMLGHTSGLAVPTFVVDVSGGGGKITLQPNHVLAWTERELLLRNHEGHIFPYRSPRAEDGRVTETATSPEACQSV